jgi:hypothetical protein
MRPGRWFPSVTTSGPRPDGLPVPAGLAPLDAVQPSAFLLVWLPSTWGVFPLAV